jgi:hypothetical protein
VLVVALFLLVLQVAFPLHTRNLLVASAQEERGTAPTPTAAQSRPRPRTEQVVSMHSLPRSPGA